MKILLREGPLDGVTVDVPRLADQHLAVIGPEVITAADGERSLTREDFRTVRYVRVAPDIERTLSLQQRGFDGLYVWDGAS